MSQTKKMDKAYVVVANTPNSGGIYTSVRKVFVGAGAKDAADRYVQSNITKRHYDGWDTDYDVEEVECEEVKE